MKHNFILSNSTLDFLVELFKNETIFHSVKL